jgi:hypothetical protein
MSAPPDLQQSLNDEIARVRKTVLPFWAGTLTATIILAAIDAAVDAVICGDDAEMLACYTMLQGYTSATAPTNAKPAPTLPFPPRSDDN